MIKIMFADNFINEKPLRPMSGYKVLPWHGFVGLPCQDINATRRKTPAERMREYRRRRKNVVESELFQESKHQVQYVEESKDATVLNYSDFYRHRLGHEEFKIKVVENPFVCERL
ncbi:UNVERIFIED_CONTAM: hypothetical protein NCL1_53971 [Trichonephila clavipes]